MLDFTYAGRVGGRVYVKELNQTGEIVAIYHDGRPDFLSIHLDDNGGDIILNDNNVNFLN